MEQPSPEEEGQLLGEGNQGQVHSAVLLVDAVRKKTAIETRGREFAGVLRCTNLVARTFMEEWMQSRACAMLQVMRYLQTALSSNIAQDVRDGLLMLPRGAPAKEGISREIGNALMRLRTDRTIQAKAPMPLSHNISFNKKTTYSVLASYRVFPLWLSHDSIHGYAFEGMIHQDSPNRYSTEPPRYIVFPAFFRVVLNTSPKKGWENDYDYSITGSAVDSNNVAEPYDLYLTRNGWHKLLLNLYTILANCSNNAVDHNARKKAAVLVKRVSQRRTKKTNGKIVHPFADTMLRSLGAAYFALHVGDVDGWDCEVQLANTQAAWHRTAKNERVPQIVPNVIPGLRLVFLDFGMCNKLTNSPTIKEGIERMRRGMWDRFTVSEECFRQGYNDALLLFWFWIESSRNNTSVASLTKAFVDSLLPVGPLDKVSESPVMDSLQMLK